MLALVTGLLFMAYLGSMIVTARSLAVNGRLLDRRLMQKRTSACLTG